MRTALPFALLALSTGLEAQRPATRPGIEMSAPVADLQYTVEFTRALAARRLIRVTTALTTSGREPVLLSLPAWTPGAYELSHFARNVYTFTATGDGKSLAWDKLDADTWRVQPNGAKKVSVTFDYRADSLDNAMAWSQPDFTFFNGTNLFLYPEGRDASFPATVAVRTESEWKVATGMAPTSARLTYSAANYHDLVDMPFFIGAFDLDSSRVADRWVRLATYPAGRLSGDQRREFWGQLDRMYQPMIDVFGDAPYDTYTNLLVFSESTDGGSALEHANSHVGIYTPLIIGNDLLASITAHEIFHVWNVKRMRPVEMTPYRYDRAQPTPLLWVSEGITDYYADLTLLRAGIVDSAGFLALTHAKMQEVNAVPPVALEDASLSTWIHPTDGTAYLYYPKGSLAGFLLDVMIRDASDNTASLDAVMRDMYRRTAAQGRGFSTEEWWSAVTRAARGKSFADFNARYVDGREPFPWTQILPLAGLRLAVDSIREPRIGVFTEMDSTGVRVTATDPGSSAQLAGLKEGDYLLAVGDISVTEGFGERFRARYGRADGQTIPVRVRRDGQELTLPMRVQMNVRTETRLLFDRAASPKALRVRRGLLTGRHG